MSNQVRRRAWVILGGTSAVSLVVGVAWLGMGAGIVLALFLPGLIGSALSWRLAER